MNEKIKQLLAQAHLEVENIKDTNKIAEEFAELIIKECSELVSCNAHVSGFSLGDLIKEHFGVEK